MEFPLHKITPLLRDNHYSIYYHNFDLNAKKLHVEKLSSEIISLKEKIYLLESKLDEKNKTEFIIEEQIEDERQRRKNLLDDMMALIASEGGVGGAINKKFSEGLQNSDILDVGLNLCNLNLSFKFRVET